MSRRKAVGSKRGPKAKAARQAKVPDESVARRGSAVSATATPNRSTSIPGTTAVITGGQTIIDPELPVFGADPIANFFDVGRPGHAVVRPQDLVALRLELHNLVVQPGSPPG